MNLPQIRLQSTFIQHGLDIKKPVQEIEQPQAELSIEQPTAEIDIQTTKGKLTIDSQEARDAVDFKRLSTRVQEWAQKGYNDSLEAIGETSQQGDMMMRIENKGNAIADIASQAGVEEFDWNIGFIPPIGSVKINYEPGRVEINSKARKPIIEATPRKPIHNYTPGKVTGYIERMNSLQIDYTGVTIDLKK